MPVKHLTPEQIRAIIRLGRGHPSGSGDDPVTARENLDFKAVLNLKYEISEPALSCASYYPESILSPALLKEIGFYDTPETPTMALAPDVEESVTTQPPEVTFQPEPEPETASVAESEPVVEPDEEDEDEEADVEGEDEDESDSDVEEEGDDLGGINQDEEDETRPE